MTNEVTHETGHAAGADEWYVMCHMKPAWIETMLRKDSRGLFLSPGEPPLPPYRFYVPYLYMPRITATPQPASRDDDRHYDPVSDENSLRNDLHNFVFIQASPERIAAIVKSDWNLHSHYRMYHYRDTNGTKVTISDAEMHRFILTMQDHHLKFFLDQPVSEFSVGDKVILQMEPWTGQLAEIKAIRIYPDCISLTVSMNIFHRTKSINFPDVNVGDVQFVDEEKGRLLSGNPITNYEEEIIDLLSHRFTHKHTDVMDKTDKERLKRLASYSRIYVEDPVGQARFTALKLLCAYLRSDRVRVAKYKNEVLSLLFPTSHLSPLTSHPSPNTYQPTPIITFQDAYLAMALFITTRDPRYRDAVKAYYQSNPDGSAILRRYHSIVKGIKPKKLKE